MPQMSRFIIGLAALVFVGVSATMNALFLSSLGRSGIEAGLLAAISLAADVTKLALPVALLRAAAQKAWGEMTAAALMLAAVTALSLTSGLGFTAVTREASDGARAAQTEKISGIRSDLRRLAAQLAAIGMVKSTKVVEAEIAVARRDRRWLLSQSCTAPSNTTAREFCLGLAKLEAALVEARERDRLEAQQRLQRTKLDALTTAGTSADDDPQATAIAALLGVERSWPRVALVSSLTVILELGSVLLVLLATGAALCAPRVPVPQPLQVEDFPAQADRSHWLRQRLQGETVSDRQNVRSGRAQ